MSSLPKPRYTPQQYLEMERKAEFKSEYINGEILAMAGASREHILIVTNLVRELSNRFRTGSCETYSTDMRTRINPSRYTYPDVVVACGPEFEDAGLDTLTNPIVIIEVLSPTTEVDDRGWKFLHYRQSPTLTDYVMITQARPFVEHYSRYKPPTKRPNNIKLQKRTYSKCHSLTDILRTYCESRSLTVTNTPLRRKTAGGEVNFICPQSPHWSRKSGARVA